MSRPVAVVVRAPGTNRDGDVATALELAGASPTTVSLAALRKDPSMLRRSQILVLAGGFSYADALGAGAVAGLELAHFLGDEVRAFVETGHPVLGICNGFQMLVRSGLLRGSLTANSQGGFVCRWVTISATATRSVWTSGLTEAIQCPVAHGEGRYLASAEILSAHTALTYVEDTDPNGSAGHAAGVTDATGLILGLMPHPENHVLERQHPRWTRGTAAGLALPLFEAGVRHAKDRG